MTLPWFGDFNGKQLLELHPSQLLSGVFLTFIILGAIALKLPISTHHGISFVDALFTATSAACVTGLMVLDAGTEFTLFGQVVILALIQVGGLGIMTFSVFFTLLLKGALSMRDSSFIYDSFDAQHQLSIRELLKRIMILTFSIEGFGFLALFIHWFNDMGVKKAAYFALFHAVSGFCNAGISLFPDSLRSFTGDMVVNGIIGTLIVIGSFGFLTIVELSQVGRKRLRGKRFRFTLQAKTILTISTILIVVAAIATFLLERNNTFSDLSLVDQIIASIFHSISRTAGFVTVDFENFSNATLLLYIILMFIGAAPGSVGGGIKVTTFGVLIAMGLARFHARESVFLFRRSIPEDIVDRAVSILFLSAQIVISFTLLLMIIETGGTGDLEHRENFMQIMFEVVSAFGTVGLSAGITPELSEPGRMLITVLMLIGRLGPLTVTLAVARKSPKGRYRYPEENMMVG
jgi:trk system potassium uptake protein TrkH